jgi:hypothetical protein
MSFVVCLEIFLESSRRLAFQNFYISGELNRRRSRKQSLKRPVWTLRVPGG